MTQNTVETTIDVEERDGITGCWGRVAEPRTLHLAHKRVEELIAAGVDPAALRVVHTRTVTYYGSLRYPNPPDR